MTADDVPRAPLRARLYIAVVGLTGVAAAVAGIGLAYPFRADPVVIVPLFIAMAVSIWSPVRFHRKGGVLGLDVFDAVLIALLFAVPLGAVSVVAGLAATLGIATRTRDRLKLVFNFGAFALKAAGAATAFALTGPAAAVLDPFTVRAVVAAILAYLVLDLLLYGSLFALLEGRRLPTILKDLAPRMVLSAGANTLIGLLLAFIVVTDRWASLFVFVLVGISLAGFRGYATALEERRRNEHLRAVSRELSDLTAPGAPSERYLAAVAELFQADAVELVATRGGTVQRTVIRDGEIEAIEQGQPGVIAAEVMRRGGPLEVDASDEGLLARHVRESGHHRTIAAPLAYDQQIVGALVVRGPSGLESNTKEVDLLATLAYDAAIAVKTLELFDEVRSERSAIEGERRKFQDIVEAASDGIVLTDAEGRLLTWNPAMADIVGHHAHDVLGQPWYMALRLRDVDGDEVPIHGGGPIQAALVGDLPSTAADLQVLRTDGEWRWVRCAISPVTRDGDVAGVVLVFHDVHRERETEELKTDFVATVSHELRTPLTPLKGLLLTMVDKELQLEPEQYKRFHASMLRQVERLESLVADLLLVADLDRGIFEPELELCDLALIASNAVLAERPADDPERLITDGIRSVPATSDPDAATRVVRALISNAVKHTPGHVVVRTYRSGGRACIDVTDEGGGIAPRDLDRIFERFSRLGNHLTRTTQGSGLGLAIAKSLAERIGGTLDVTSERGRGTTFTLSLPGAGPPRDGDDQEEAHRDRAPDLEDVLGEKGGRST